MYRTRSKKSGFTLVEILIVVIILGILAAIVIPQFTNASQDARKSSLTSQLQTIRSQLSLAGLQHHDTASKMLLGGGTTSWDDLTVKTDDAYGTTAGTLTVYGPYFNSAPVNPLDGGSIVLVSTSTTDPDLTTDATSGATDKTVGWVYYTATGKIYATTASGTKLYNETGTGSFSDNSAE
jgi:general secretion pathway protein G